MHMNGGLMRKLAILVMLTIAVLPSVARADTWNITEGVCNEWVGTWSITETSTNIWTGKVQQRQVAAPCNGGASGAIKTADIRVIISGSNFTAQMTGASDNVNCAYNGGINGKQVVGTYICGTFAGTFHFTLNM